MLNPTKYDMEGKRIEKRITLQEIMKATGIKIYRLLEIENERTTPTEEEAKAICDFIGGYGL